MTFPALMDVGGDRVLIQRPTAVAVYLYLVKHLDFRDFRVVKAWVVAEYLGVQRQTVGTALDTLCTEGYLEAGAYDGRARMYRLVFARQPKKEPDQ